MKKALLVTLILTTFLFIFTNATIADSIKILTPKQPIVIPNETDYASNYFGNPWDMSNRGDIRFTKDLHVSFKKGIAKIKRAKRRRVTVVFTTISYPRAYNYAYREADKYPIKDFRRLIYKWYDYEKRKWRISIESTMGKRTQFFLTFPRVVKLDWVNVVKKSKATDTTIEWQDNRSPGSTKGRVDIAAYLDMDKNGHDGVPISKTRSRPGFNKTTVNLSGIEPGQLYYLYLSARQSYWDGTGWSSKIVRSDYSAPIIVKRGPRIRITSTKEQGNGDWAKRYLGRSWNFNRHSDVAATKNVRSVRFRKGIFSGVNSNNDPTFNLQLSNKSIDTRKYNRLTFRYNYQGNFDLDRGTMLRIGWRSDRYSWQMSDDIVTYPGWHTYTVDLRKIRLNVGKIGWKGLVKGLRIDPNEDAGGPRRFYFSKVRLARGDTLSSSYRIKFSLNTGPKRRSKVRLYADRDRKFGNKNERLIKKGTYKSGKRSYNWRPSRRFRGNYYIYAQASDGFNTNGNYSSGYIKVH